ncbi:MAG: YchF/TatD family DNA exonuclease [Ignavibacteria bacterium]|nr:YchF/TatD family DNA exonuclease [Ignavibacteria bacterium]
MIDTHCHLFFDELYNDLDKVIDEAKQAGVSHIICPATNLETSIKSIEIAEKYENVYVAVGIHPHDTKNVSSQDFVELEKLLQSKKVVAVGEIGLDYFYYFSPKDKQQYAFREQLLLAKDHNLPVIIHNRDASEDLMNIFESELDGNLIGQFHCFSGDLKMARRIVELRSFVSFTGNITYPKNEDLRKVVKGVETDNILLETDAPFMSPLPIKDRNKNRPAYLKYTAQKIAEIQNFLIDDIIRATTFNANRVFGIGVKKDVAFTYQIGESLYINVTNRCNADCVFCDRKGEAVVKGYNLKMLKDMEPPSEVYIKEIGDPTKYKEIVFCGFGEPTIRMNIIKEVAKYVKDNGGRTRLNTDGHGNVINKRNILPELNGLIDSVSISLNSVDKKQYAKLMRVSESMFDEMINFTLESKKYIPEVIMTIVGLSSVDEEKARKFVEDELGVKFRTREYF